MDEDHPLVLREAAQFKALGHPVRHRIVNALRQRPATLRQLAEAMSLAKGTVSFHVRVLREAGLVRLAEARHVRGGTEQYFALTSDSFRLPGDVADGTRFLYDAALAEMVPSRSPETGHTVLRHLWLSTDEARALASELDAAAEAGQETGTDREPYGLLVSLFRADIPQLPKDEQPNDKRPPS
ncbi:MAG TPA: winged helix-turn-helix domain-containing protein [Trebonia sp.]|jgi:DNA-binding transcriptional ArsR family regulator|nr:winged helix-turn-helix domain-containing protein [Trebonia sp.]